MLTPPQPGLVSDEMLVILALMSYREATSATSTRQSLVTLADPGDRPFFLVQRPDHRWTIVRDPGTESTYEITRTAFEALQRAKVVDGELEIDGKRYVLARVGSAQHQYADLIPV